MASYASETTVAPGRSRDEIEKTLTRYGASGFGFGQHNNTALVLFTMHDRQIRFTVPIPTEDDEEIRLTPGRQRRTEAQRKEALKKAERQRWRALALVVKAKLEAVESRIVTFEEEFAMFMVLPNGSTVADTVLPAIEASYDSGLVPPMLGIGA